MVEQGCGPSNKVKATTIERVEEIGCKEPYFKAKV